MRKMIYISLFIFALQAIKAQESYFKVEHFGVYIPNKSITLSFPNLKKEQIEAKILKFIDEKKYVYKPFFSGDGRIVFRDFSVICQKEKCKADLVAKNFFYLDFGDGFVKISFENEIYSTIVGAKLFINNNDDVASENNLPFGIYEFSAPYKYEDAYPESIFTYNKASKPTLRNPEILEIFLTYYNQFINDFKNNMMSNNYKETALLYLKKYEEKDLEAISEMFSEDIFLRDWKIKVEGKEKAIEETRKNFQNAETIKIEVLSCLENKDTIAAELKIIINKHEELTVVDVINMNSEGKINSIKAFVGRL